MLIHDTLTHLVPNIQETAELVQEISAASREQRGSVEQVNLAVQQLDQATQQNAAIAEETAETLTQQAEHIQKTVAFFSGQCQSSCFDDQSRALILLEAMPSFFPGEDQSAQRPFANPFLILMQ